jgi:von Willebrand factor type A domain
MRTDFFVLVLSLSIMSALMGCGKKDEPLPVKAGTGVSVAAISASATFTKAVPQVAKTTKHVVKKGEFMNAIADRYGVAREGLILTNVEYLITKYQETCPEVSKKKKKSLFCNDRYNKAWANTLLPGWEIQIETSDSSASSLGQANAKAIDAAVTDLPKNAKLAIVLDVSGSMSDKMNRAAQYVMSVRKQNGGALFGLYVYHETVARIEDINTDEKLMLSTTRINHKLKGDGGIENTKKALQKAFADGAEHVVVISDEVGDDWGDWSEVKAMPPVTAVCMTRTGNDCFESFAKLAKYTKGKYVRLD